MVSLSTVNDSDVGSVIQYQWLQLSSVNTASKKRLCSKSGSSFRTRVNGSAGGSLAKGCYFYEKFLRISYYIFYVSYHTFVPYFCFFCYYAFTLYGLFYSSRLCEDKMPMTCAIYKCRTGHKRKKDEPEGVNAGAVFSFPDEEKDPELRAIWIKFVNRVNWTPSKYASIKY